MKKIIYTLISIGVIILVLTTVGCDCCGECCDKEEKEEESGILTTQMSPQYAVAPASVAPTYAPQQAQQTQPATQAQL